MCQDETRADHRQQYSMTHTLFRTLFTMWAEKGLMPLIVPLYSVNNGLHSLVCELDVAESLMKGEGLSEHPDGISEVSSISAAGIQLVK